MAEKYGVVPPRFTKAWWSYFWEYYKWRVIGIGGASLCVVFTVVQCATRTKYDMNITYAGHKIYTQEKMELLGDVLSQYISDIDGNGKNSIFMQQITFSDQSGYEEYDYAAQTKLDLEMQENRSFIFLLDKEMLDNMLNREYFAELYVPVSEWAESSVPEDLLYSKEDTAYAVSLKDSKLMEENEIYHEDLYILIEKNYRDDEENVTAYNDSVNVANILIE